MNEATLKSRLSSYIYNRKRLKELDQLIRDIWTNGGMKGLTYDSPSLCEDNKFHSSTEDTAEKNMDTYGKLIKEHAKCETEMLDIDARMDRLEFKEYVLVKAFYINKWTWEEIATKTGYRANYIKGTLHRQAIEKMLE